MHLADAMIALIEKWRERTANPGFCTKESMWERVRRDCGKHYTDGDQLLEDLREFFLHGAPKAQLNNGTLRWERFVSWAREQRRVRLQQADWDAQKRANAEASKEALPHDEAHKRCKRILDKLNAHAKSKGEEPKPVRLTPTQQGPKPRIDPELIDRRRREQIAALKEAEEHPFTGYPDVPEADIPY